MSRSQAMGCVPVYRGYTGPKGKDPGEALPAAKQPFEQLLAVAREVSFMKGAELVRQGEASRGCFLIRAGSVEARVALPGGGALTVAQFGDGDMFGEMALIERGVVSATVVAKSNVDAWFVATRRIRRSISLGKSARRAATTKRSSV